MAATPTGEVGRLDEVLAEYLDAVARGGAPDRDALLARNPDLASALEEFFSDQDRMNGLAGVLPGTPPTPQFVPPKVRYFGNYELLDEIARGGMGVVYRARQTSLNRVVALKMILSGHLAGVEDVKRFKTEAEAAANLKHPGIVSVHEVGVHEGQHYFSMDYIAGRSLAEIVRENPLPATRAAGYVQSIASAVHYAHQQGTLHRDLKPSNILIDAEDRVHVTDFGLAMRVAGDSELTRTGQILGTPAYMPPEQAQAKRALIGPASDVYSLGVILYELLTGRPPFKTESVVATIQQVIHAEPVSPRLLNSKVPRDLETICLKCLQKEPHKRYGTAGLLADDLRRWLNGEPILARPIGSLGRLWRWSRRNRAIAGLAAAIVVLLAVVMPGLLLLHAQRIGHELTRTQLAEQTTMDRLAESYRHLAQARRLSKSVGQRHESLQSVADSLRILKELPLPEAERQKRLGQLRTEAIAALALPDLHVIRETTVQDMGWPGGMDSEFEQFTWLHYPGGDLTLRRISDGDETARFRGNHVWSAKINPDGTLIASADGNAGLLKVWQPGTSDPVFTAPWANAPWEFSADGRWLAVGNRRGTADLYDVAARSLALQIATPGAPIRMDFHPSGDRIALTCAGRVRVFDVEDGAPVEIPPILGVDDIAWHPDGRHLAATQRDGRIEVWDTVTGQHVSTMAGDDGDGVVLAFDATGNILASSGWRSELRLWQVATGELLLRTPNDWTTYRFHDQRAWLGPICRGQQVAVAEFTWPAVFRTLVHTPAYSPSRYFRLAVSPDSRLLAVQLLTGLALWDLPSGRELGFLPLGLTAPVFEPTGALLTLTPQGLFRWPIREDIDAADVLHLGPPEQLLALAARSTAAAISADGRVLALCHGDGALVWQIGGPDSPRALPHPNAPHADISPDGRLVATAYSSAMVWDAATGVLLHEFETQALSSDVEFSPDGRWLTTVGGRHRLWQVGDWETGYDLGPSGNESRAGAFATTAAGANLLAIAHDDGTLRLLDPDTRREKACLTNPAQGRSEYLAFSPDGRRLIAGDNDSHTLHVWDIAMLRGELSKHGLDWDDPPYPAAAAPRPIRELRIEGDLSTFGRAWAEAEVPRMTDRLTKNAADGEAEFRRGQAHLHLGEIEQAVLDLQSAFEHGVDSLTLPGTEPWIHAHWLHWQRDLKQRAARFTQQPGDSQLHAWAGYDAYALQEHSRAVHCALEALRINSSDATAHNLLARLYLLGPLPLRDAEQGFEHALRAYELDASRNHAATLAAAHFRLNRLDSAREFLPGPRSGVEGLCDLFLLALIEKQTGDAPRARELFLQAVQRADAARYDMDLAELGELYRLRAEAEQDLPAD